MGDWGIKISQPGVDVKEATEGNLYFTSKYPVLKATRFGQISTTADVWSQVAHGLSYAPSYMVWAKGSGNEYRFIAPRRIVGADPVGGLSVVRAYTDTTNLNIITSADSDVYYYIFVDPF